MEKENNEKEFKKMRERSEKSRYKKQGDKRKLRKIAKELVVKKEKTR